MASSDGASRAGISSGRIGMLLLLTAAVYAPVIGHPFCRFDDIQYVQRNPYLQAGLSIAGGIWAFTTSYFGNWHPLTWISYLVDFELFGKDPQGYHLTNLLLHLVGSGLLFAALQRATNAPGRSVVVAGLFALHPFHVESVAWISARKDVLSGCFWGLTLWTYVRYAEQPASRVRRNLVVLCLGLGLMAKATLVTLPFVLLLLDFWPLRRVGSIGLGRDAGTPGLGRLLTEKWLLFLLAAASCLVTFIVQQQAGAVSDASRLSLDLRVWNGLLAYCSYIGKTFWPVGLAVFYPHPLEKVSISHALGGSAFLLALTFLVLGVRRSRPWLAVGWFWFLGTLVPVIGLVQIGMQAMADRYTYLPLTGLFLAAVWETHERVSRAPRLRRALPLVALAVLGSCALATRAQLAYWHDGAALFGHALEVTQDNAFAEFNYADALLARRRNAEAIVHYRRVTELWHDPMPAFFGLGNAYARLAKLDEAARSYEKAIQIRPRDPRPRLGLAAVRIRLGELPRAELQLEEILKIDPNDTQARALLQELHRPRREPPG